MFRNLAVCILQYAHLQTCCFRSSTVSSRWLQLVATLVKYNHNSIENISTLSYRVTVVLIASKLDVGLSHTLVEQLETPGSVLVSHFRKTFVEFD